MAAEGGSAGAWGGPMTSDPRGQANHSPILEGKMWNVLDSLVCRGGGQQDSGLGPRLSLFLASRAGRPGAAS